MIYESNHSVPIVAIERTLSIMASHQLSLAARSPPMDRSYSWVTPPDDYLKLNVDGAIFFEFEKVGVGFLVGDHKGETHMALKL